MTANAELIQVGNDIIKAPAVGALIELDGCRLNERLHVCEFPEFAPFRFPSSAVQFVTKGECVGPACRVEVTARKVVLRPGGCWVRVAVTFVGDGEPDTVVGGYMAVEFANWAKGTL